MKEKDIFKRDKYQERKEEPQKEPKCGQERKGDVLH
jgi:hypothetical protein